MINILPDKIKKLFFKDKDNNDINPFKSSSNILMFIIFIINIIVYYNSILYVNIILITIIVIIYLFSLNKKKDKSFTLLLSLIPIIPANRIYLNNLDIDTILIRIIPILGNIYDLYYTFYKNTLIPENGWISD
jgi:hypothetical protein